jgi:beta-1,4-mannosyl-glycoprotein beta-1,4-N-acetylglucosaminyltransferase
MNNMSSITSPYAMVYPTGPITIDRKIIDCFIFYNELQMLTYRLNVLYDTVDYFIIVEATHTHTGRSKPLYFNENKHLFDKFQDKIIHIIVEDFPCIYPNIDTNKGEQWTNERHQRNCIARGFDKIMLNHLDIIIIADLDEIPDPTTLSKIKRNEIEVNIQSLQMDFYYYNLNSKINETWGYAKILTFNQYKYLNKPCNSIRQHQCSVIDKGGWHLSYFGDSQFIKNKLENFGHQELNIDKFTDIEKIQKRICEGLDLFDRNDIVISKIPIKENPYLPPQYETYLQNFVIM